MTAARSTKYTEYDHLAPLFDQLANDQLPERTRQQLRDRIVAEHLPIAEHIARRFRNRGQPEDDLRQVAALGLIQAVDRFDPSRGSNFLAFAVPTITGEVRRYFRDSTWSVRVPRRTKELHAAIMAKATELSHELDRAPRPTELAEAMELPLADVQEGLAAAAAYQSASLDEIVAADEASATSLGDLLGTDDHRLADVVDRQSLFPALATLAERERTIIVLRFFGNLTQTQIAERVGLSQMHVSRLLAASITAMREAMTASPATVDGD
ncbi:MAG TPA: SigB/SigF/SigG family RNA polymerase sigma factor [Pseudonocardiaceae bacterium]|jgi:RNA polymerase sigma-B factor|nr:SigB/SigF/SigG family RNA polymerase sigma factor [Pseudonocardiaceae bacterium]